MIWTDFDLVFRQGYFWVLMLRLPYSGIKPRDDLNSEELRQRTMAFALRVIGFVRSFPNDLEGQVFGRQLLRSATSVAANYRAACRSRSKREFYAKLCIVVEETDESLFWMELTKEAKVASDPDLANEAKELLYIFSASRKTTRENMKSPY